MASDRAARPPSPDPDEVAAARDHPVRVMRVVPRQALPEPGGRSGHGGRDGRVPTDTPSTDRPLRPFDRRLLGRTAVARWTLLISVAAGLAGTLLLLAQMTLLAAVIAGAAEGRLDRVPAAVARPAGGDRGRPGRAGPRGRAERAAHGHQGAVGPAVRAGRAPAPPRRRRARRQRRAGHRRRPGGRRPRDLLRPLPAPGGPGGRGPAGRAVLERRRRPHLGAGDGRDRAGDPGVHGPDRPGRGRPGAGQLRGPGRPLGLVPGRRPRPADAAGLQPGRRPGGRDPRGHRPLPPHHHGARCGCRSCPGPSSTSPPPCRPPWSRSRSASAWSPAPSACARPSPSCCWSPSCTRPCGAWPACTTPAPTAWPAPSASSTPSTGSRPTPPRRRGPPPRPPGRAGPLGVGLRGVTVRYPGRSGAALEQVDLDLHPGELVAWSGRAGPARPRWGGCCSGSPGPTRAWWWSAGVPWPRPTSTGGGTGSPGRRSIPPWWRGRWRRT